MSIPQNEASEKPGAVTLALVIAATALIPAAFWAAVVWLVWGALPAAIAGTIALLGSIVIVGIVRSAAQVETPEPAPRHERETVRIGPWPATMQQAA
jgi:hypothetical protein